jgi:hypothetical protein
MVNDCLRDGASIAAMYIAIGDRQRSAALEQGSIGARQGHDG